MIPNTVETAIADTKANSIIEASGNGPSVDSFQPKVYFGSEDPHEGDGDGEGSGADAYNDFAHRKPVGNTIAMQAPIQQPTDKDDKNQNIGITVAITIGSLIVIR